MREKEGDAPKRPPGLDTGHEERSSGTVHTIRALALARKPNREGDALETRTRRTYTNTYAIEMGMLLSLL